MKPKPELSPLSDGNDIVDQKLLREIREDSEQAFGRLYVRYHKPLLSFLQKIVQSGHDAEDLAHEVFLRLWSQRAGIDPERNVGSWIFVTARRVAVDRYRNKSKEREFSDGAVKRGVEAFDLSPEEMLEQTETKLLIDIAIEQMPARQRDIFSLHYYQGLTQEQIADRLKISKENVRKQIYNSKSQLRDLVAMMIAFISAGGSDIFSGGGGA